MLHVFENDAMGIEKRLLSTFERETVFFLIYAFSGRLQTINPFVFRL